MTRSVDVAHVVIPAHREVALLGRQLLAVRAAVAHAARDWPRVRASVTVILDSCDDGTDEVVAGFPEVAGVPVRLRCVGAARHRGRWLTSQLELAARGTDLVLGTVSPDTDHLSADLRRRWVGRHVLQDGHPHVHGANLGFRLSTYDAVGGFRPLALGEDVDLAARMWEAGAHIVRSGRDPVITSARLEGRVSAGFASYLLAL
jgi:hypothetical protein